MLSNSALLRWKWYFRLLGLGKGFSQILDDGARWAFDRYRISSYSQTGEDRVIDFYLSGFSGADAPGFYVEVGSNHPIWFSNSYFFYLRGWVGIVVDANEDFIRMHQKLRPLDKSVCAVASSVSRDAEFVEFFHPCLSTLDPSHAAKWEVHSPVKSRRRVVTEPLSSILDKNQCPTRFDFLSIDVEGHDYEVLTSIDLGRHRPKLICIEMHEFDLGSQSQSPIYSHLIEHGYKLVGYATWNGYFIDVSSS